MRLAEALSLPARGALSLVGGGGKTSMMLRLARELSADGLRVVVTTTTRISREQGEAAGYFLLGGDVEALRDALEAHPVVCAVAPAAQAGKLSAPDGEVLRAARTLADWVLDEADGARCLPVKAPAAHEPVLLPRSDVVVAVAGLSALGRPLSQVCHRSGLAAARLGVPADTLLTPALLARLLTSPEGQRKGVEDPSAFRVVLNQADDARSLALAARTAGEIKTLLPGCRVAATALREDNCVKEVF